jgi:hypothetical protein
MGQLGFSLSPAPRLGADFAGTQERVNVAVLVPAEQRNPDLPMSDTQASNPGRPAPEALVYVGSACPHCGGVLDALTGLVKQGLLARLEIVNLTAGRQPAPGDAVRSVPWTRIGHFELVGAIPAEELADWAERAAAGTGWAAYYVHLLEHRRLDEVERLVRTNPAGLRDLLTLVGAEATPMALRIGIGAVAEDLAGDPALRAAVPVLVQLTLSATPQARADACHFLGLAGDPQAVPAVRRLLDDERPDVREIAAETLALLGADELDD